MGEGIVFEDILDDIFITPTLLRVVRVFRIGRVLRLIKAAKGIRKLLFAIIISLPALFNIGMLLFLVMFIYAIFGMTTFGNIRHTSFLNDITNFETFFRSMILLFRLTTAGGWNDVLDPMLNNDNCNSTHRIMPDGNVKEVTGGDCANPGLSIAYMVTYIIISYLIIINMYIAVILENFNQAHEQEEVGITEDDFEMFYVVWEKYDPHATQFIKCEHLSDLVADLDEPLGIPKPNEIALVAFDLPIMEGERMHCVDILTALVKHVLGGVNEDSKEFQEAKVQMEQIFKTNFPTKSTQVLISSTMRRKKEDVAAKTLQRAWRQHKAAQSMRRITEMAMEAKLNRSLSKASFSTRRDSSRSDTSDGLQPKEDVTCPPSGGGDKPKSTNVQQQQKKHLSNTLKVPTVGSIRLPSENSDIDV